MAAPKHYKQFKIIKAIKNCEVACNTEFNNNKPALVEVGYGSNINLLSNDHIYFLNSKYIIVYKIYFPLE